MAGFEQTVAVPSTRDYASPTPDIFAQIAGLPNAYYQGVFNSQQRDLNSQAQEMNRYRIADQQRQQDIARTFQGGLPRSPDGSIDYSKAVAMLAQKGDTSALWNGADAMLLQQAAKGSPMLNGGPQPQQPVAPQGAPAPRVPVQQGVQGDPGSGSITALVTDRFPNQDTTTGQTISKIASVMGVDPNATLTPGQVRRAQGLLQKYAPADAGGGGGGGEPASPAQRVAGAFDRLPPSANAGTPAATAQPAPNGAPGSAAASPGAPPAQPQQPQPQPQQPQPQPQAAPVAQAAPQGGPVAPAPGQPIVPQVPLPKGFTDPQAAILALRAEAARLSANPRAQGQVQELNNWASRIEESLKPVRMGPNDSYLDPRTGQVVAEGPAAASMRAMEIAGASGSLDADAERYRQSGQLPPNMGRGLQGAAEARAIRQRAQQLEQEAGGDPTEWPKKWQQFKGQQVAIQRFTSGPQGNTIRSFNVLVDHLDTLNEAAAALKNGDTRLLNRFKQTWAANTGGTAPTNFDGVKALVGDEIVKAVVGSAGALADREEVKKDLDRASSPQQLAQLVEKYKKLALGQLHGLQKQYETSTGLKNFGDMLLPGTLKALGGETEGNKSEPAKDAGNVTPGGFSWSVVK
jgi:hypothetical protein